jgi:SAM-dependent methyltransferase
MVVENYKNRLYNTYVSSGQAVSGDLLRDKAPYMKRLIRRHMPPHLNSRIVDLGCGYGKYLYYFKKYGYHNLLGIDTSAEQVKLAHQLGITEVQQGDIQSFLASDTGQADVILLMDVIEHLPLQTVFDLLDSVYAKLNPGGKVIIHVPNAEGLFGMRIRYGDLTHELAFSPTSVRQLGRSVGFSRLKCEEDKPLVHGFTSLIRRIIWDCFTAPIRLLMMAETGKTHFVLSQNMLVVAEK